MQDDINPYAAPQAIEINPIAVQWLGAPSESLTRVARGLGLIYTSIVVILLSAIGGTVLAVVAAVAAGPTAAMAVGILMEIGIIVGVIMNIVGEVYCLSTPPESGARGLIYTSVGTSLTAAVLSLGVSVHILPAGFTGLQGILSLISGITFLFFLRQLGQFIGREDLAGRAMWILKFCIGVVLFFALMFVAPLLGIVALILFALAFIMYANLLVAMRKAILGIS